MESKLRSGTTLIVDRYAFSGIAFSSAKGLDVEWCKVGISFFVFFVYIDCSSKPLLSNNVHLQAPEAGLLAPDLVVYLDISPEVPCF